MQSLFCASLFCDRGFDDRCFVIAVLNVDRPKLALALIKGQQTMQAAKSCRMTNWANHGYLILGYSLGLNGTTCVNVFVGSRRY